MANKPDHPRQRELALIEQQLRDGPIISHGAAIVRSATDWRFCWDMAPDMFVDACVTPRHAWTLSKDAIGIYPVNPNDVPEGPTGRRGHPVDSYNTFAQDVWRLLTGGFGCSRPFHYEVGAVTVTGRAFAVTLIGLDAGGTRLGTVTLTGEWDDARACGKVVSRVVNTEGQAAGSIGRETYENARWDDATDRFVYSSVAQTTAAGRLSRRTVLEEFRALTNTDFESFTAVPSAGGTDAVRGRLNIVNVADMRNAVVTAHDPDGHPVETTRLPGAEQPHAGGALYWSGIGLVVGAGGLCLFLLVRRGMASRH